MTASNIYKKEREVKIQKERGQETEKEVKRETDREIPEIVPPVPALMMNASS
jgi:hypothetical protein